jgi:exosortase
MVDALGVSLVDGPRTWGQWIPWASRVRIAVVAALIVLTYWTVIRHQLVSTWWSDGNWSHGWLIPLFSLYFLASRRDRLFQCEPRPNYLGALILAGSLAAYFLSAWRFRLGYPQALSMVGAIFGVTLLMGGWSIMRVAWFPIAFLLLAIPLPQRYFVLLTMPLRKFVSEVAAAVMPIFAPGLHTEAQSVVIDYIMPGYGAGQLDVEEACSGMRSIMAFATLGIAVAYLHERPAWQRTVLLLSCVPIALFCNVIRVVVTGLLIVYEHRDFARGTPHTVLGVLMFLLALGLFGLISRVIGRLWIEVSESPSVRRKFTL